MLDFGAHEAQRSGDNSDSRPPHPKNWSARERASRDRQWWRGLDSNQRTLARADLQSAAFNHSATSPRGQEPAGRRAKWRCGCGVSTRARPPRLPPKQIDKGPYQRLIHQPPYIVGDAQPRHPNAAISNQIRHADRAGEAGGAGFLPEQRPASVWHSLQPPFATRSNPRNEMSVGQRLFWIATIAIGATFSAGMYLAGLESLARLLKS
jgi:hypothetical protein